VPQLAANNGAWQSRLKSKRAVQPARVSTPCAPTCVHVQEQRCRLHAGKAIERFATRGAFRYEDGPGAVIAVRYRKSIGATRRVARSDFTGTSAQGTAHNLQRAPRCVPWRPLLYVLSPP